MDMTSVLTPIATEQGSAAAAPLLTRPLVVVCAVNVTAMLAFYLLLTVVPSHAAAAGLGSVGAGVTAGAMMLAAVAAELAAAQLIGRYGYRATLAGGLVLLGGPALALPVVTGLPELTGISVVRGVGFGLVVVAIGGLAASVVPASRRGEGLALLGVSSNLPAVVGLPLGVVLIDEIGFSGVFAVGAITALAGAMIALAAPSLRVEQAGSTPLGPVLRLPQLRRSVVVFLGMAAGSSLLGSFLPTAATSLDPDTVAAALLLFTGTATVARWYTGRLADRVGAIRLIAPAVVTSAVGMAGLVWLANPIAVTLAATVFGLGFGAAQAGTSTAMFQAAMPNQYAAVSAIWNVAYDLGLGFGPVVFGVVATYTGYPAGFAGCAALLLLTLILYRRPTAGPTS
jgi:predicted MFS family arabinose efflux permease